MNYQYGFQTLTLNVERKCLTTCTYMIELLFKRQNFVLHIVFYLRFCNKTNNCEETKYAMQISHRYFP